ncbi:MAG: hypothetical protein PHH26_05845, partial [Candidatus Thermoplasmatota archaeon]|nr:hypothetical protein [Candidatus Thermoplasmatota archaeon]
AFPSLKDGKIQESAGSATVDSLEYGFFLALWEINLNMLQVNARQHKVVDWEKSGAEGWLEILTNGMWRAYSTDRFPSFTQRSQFAQFMVGWEPDGEVSFANPGGLFTALENKKIKSHHEATAALNQILPAFLKGWNCTKENKFVSHCAANCSLSCLE